MRQVRSCTARRRAIRRRLDRGSPARGLQHLQAVATIRSIHQVRSNVVSTIAWESNFDQACRRAVELDRFVLLDFFSPV
jgi:hypothetical protein